MNVTFSKEGSIYFVALNCRKDVIENLTDISSHLKAVSSIDPDEWKHFFIVTGLWIAERALVMQSSSSSASMQISGDVKGLEVGSSANVNANASVKVTAYKDASFIKDWSSNVTIFFSLARFKPSTGNIIPKAFGISNSIESVEVDELEDEE